MTSVSLKTILLATQGKYSFILCAVYFIVFDVIMAHKSSCELCGCDGSWKQGGGMDTTISDITEL